jgi:hypothetical protein
MHRNSGWAGHAYMIVAGALVGFALILQFYLTANLVVAQGGHLVTAVLVFLDFFTILTNILVLAALAAPWIAPESRLAVFFRRPVVLGAIASYIAIVGIIYTLLLLDFRASEGPPLWADVLLHDIGPVLFVIYWLFLVPRGWLHWRHPVLWLGVPTVLCGLRDASVHGDPSLPLPIHRCSGSRIRARVLQRGHALVRILDRRPCVRRH